MLPPCFVNLSEADVAPADRRMEKLVSFSSSQSSPDTSRQYGHSDPEVLLQDMGCGGPLFFAAFLTFCQLPLPFTEGLKLGAEYLPSRVF